MTKDLYTDARIILGVMWMPRGAVIIITVLVLAMAFGIAGGSQGDNTERLNKEMWMRGNDTAYTPHDPIKIDGDADFDSAHGVVMGNGTKDDPYIIESWEIDAQGGISGIYIANTTKYFVVKNCKIYNATAASTWYYEGAGIVIRNAKNGILENNTLYDNEDGVFLKSSNNVVVINNTCKNNDVGISLRDSSNNVIINNTCNNNSDKGIYASGSTNNDIRNNTVSNSEYGIYLRSDSDNNIIRDNRVYNNSGGIYIDYSSGTKIINNTFANTSWDVISLTQSDNNTIYNNTIYGGEQGIDLRYSNNNTIIDNRIMDGLYGIYISSSTGTKIYGNKMWHNGIFITGDKETYTKQDIAENNTVNGKPVYYYKNTDMGYASVPSNAGQVILGNVTRIKIDGLKIDNASVGIIVGYSFNITISNNTCTNNSGDGIHISHSNNIVIRHNHCMDNDDGIYLINSNGNLIEENTCTGNSGGISIFYSSNNTVVKNEGMSNGDGIFLNYADNTTLKNNTLWNNSLSGIYLYKSSNNRITNTSFHLNTYGIMMDNSNNNVIDKNTITYSRKNGIYLGASDDNIINKNYIGASFEYGIIIYQGKHNIIYNNTFVCNYRSGTTYDSDHIQASDKGTDNQWNSTSGYGNFWLDWAYNNDTNDANNDGFVDWPYKIDGQSGVEDHYPLKYRTVITVPLPPESLEATAGNGYVYLTWKSPCDDGGQEIKEYRIYRNGMLIDTVPPSQLWYNDTGVVNGQTYTYYVTAVNTVGESYESNVISAEPSGSVPEFSEATFIFAIALIGIILGVTRPR